MMVDTFRSPQHAPQGLTAVLVSGIRLVREGLEQALLQERRIHLAGCCAAPEALTEFGGRHPDLVLLDASSGDAATSMRRIRATCPAAKVIVFAITEQPDAVMAWARAGAAGYIPSTAALSEVVPLVFDILNGLQCCSPNVASCLLKSLADRSDSSAREVDCEVLGRLTSREMQILELLSCGQSNKEISRSLKIGLATTKSHVHNLLAKLNFQRRTHAALWMRARRLQ